MTKIENGFLYKKSLSNPQKNKIMPIQTERLSENAILPRWVQLEHIARFEFACQFVKEKIVLDCACGSGIGSKMFAKAKAKKVWAFDINKEEIKKNNEKNTEPDMLMFSMADAERLPLPDNFADVYISFETIEHIENDQKYLKESKRVLKPGGIFICSTPNRTITNPGKSINDKPWNKFHIREYSAEEFTNLLKLHFGNIQLYGQNPARPLKTKIMTKIGKILPLHGAIWINRLLKLPWFFKGLPSRHRINQRKGSWEYEYLIIVAQKEMVFNDF